MGMILEKGMQQAKQFYIEQLIKNGIYQPQDKELSSMTLNELKEIYRKETISRH